MAPHGPGLFGAGHSHDPEYPDDSWNLYSMLDASGTTSYNVTQPDHTIGIFKPFVRKFDEFPQLISDADQEIIVTAQFISPVHIRKLMIIGGGEPSKHPSLVKCYVNHNDIDFTNIQSYSHTQQFNTPINEEGNVEVITPLQSFSNITSITFYFPSNFGNEEVTIIKYIGMQGEHTHYRREAVNATYEVICNGQDIITPEDATANLDHMH
jgi:hypothetical protein